VINPNHISYIAGMLITSELPKFGTVFLNQRIKCDFLKEKP